MIKEEIVRELYAIAGEDAVQTAEPMKNHTTFRVGGPADYFVAPHTEEEIRKIVALCEEKEIPWFVTGNGSNLVVSDEGYHSVIKDRGYVVLGAELMLAPGDKEEILARMQELKNKRVEKQPLEYPSAGSAFKRPEGYFAGKLVMDAGLSGYAVGGAKVSEKHCGFLINAGGATASDVMELIRQIQAKVKEQFGVQLEPEIQFLGEF